VVVVGDSSIVRSVRGALPNVTVPAKLHDYELSRAGAPSTSEPAGPDFGRARAAYVSASFGACLDVLSDERWLDRLLADRRRDEAARLLFWRAACHDGKNEAAPAEAAVRELASRGLSVPALDAATVGPDLETSFAAGAQAVRSARRIRVSLSSARGAGLVFLDGAAEGCAVPCSVELFAGRHTFVLEGERVEREVKAVEVTAGGLTEVRFGGVAPPPAVAADRWLSLYSGSAAIDSASSLALLALAVPARNVVLVQAEAGNLGRIKGSVVVSGSVSARAERTFGSPTQVASKTDSLLEELLTSSRLVERPAPLYARPWFWVAVGVVAAGAATGTYFLVRPAERRTEVILQ
jgi:hypothetical protein